MDFTNPEKTALIVLSVLLLAGAITLHIKRPGGKVFSLKETEKHLVEKRKVSINTATLEQLVAVPGVGRTFAARIIERRDRKGPFRSERDLLDVKGIGEKKLDKMEPFIKIE